MLGSVRYELKQKYRKFLQSHTSQKPDPHTPQHLVLSGQILGGSVWLQPLPLWIQRDKMLTGQPDLLIMSYEIFSPVNVIYYFDIGKLASLVH